ncbi:hypothetical protein L484_010473 [Morus notabilis]|uniref:Uncharacterized protein n=1 Tax=Morus notabilis TaxID=981085 RepID=W9QZU5_9ROSA|nr:hypothetical protein L484_010473 [Morus notabilis]
MTQNLNIHNLQNSISVDYSFKFISTKFIFDNGNKMAHRESGRNSVAQSLSLASSTAPSLVVRTLLRVATSMRFESVPSAGGFADLGFI